MNANVDDKCTAWLTAAIAVEEGEAAFELVDVTEHLVFAHAMSGDDDVTGLPR